jgi:hypothetical protein
MAVGRDHKLETGKVVKGSVGHDRIQMASGEESIGEAIRYWYGLPEGRDFVTIEVEAAIHSDGHFILVPLSVLMEGQSRPRVLERVHAPLSFHRDHQSRIWREQIGAKRKESSGDVSWAASQVAKVVADHGDSDASHILEADLLRAAGALSILGLTLGPYLGKGYDCPRSSFQFGPLPLYPCPVEVKKRSKGFKYQMTKYVDLPRVVVLCMKHDRPNLPDHVDVIELAFLGEYLS